MSKPAIWSKFLDIFSIHFGVTMYDPRIDADDNLKTISSSTVSTQEDNRPWPSVHMFSVIPRTL